jgi:hypothetical protein
MVFVFLLAACGPTGVNDNGGQGGTGGSGANAGGGGTAGSGGSGGGGGGQAGCGELTGCYTVYAHSDHVLYHVDLVAKQLITVGPFHAPQVRGNEDVITDLAVSPDDIIYAVSNTNLYTASPQDGHVTLIGPLGSCGTQAVALSFTVEGGLYAADFMGAFCKIDITQNPPHTIPVGTLGQGLALAGDLVAVGDGTMFGTAYRLSDQNGGTQNDNLLVKINPTTGQVTAQQGQTGFPKLFGIAYDQGKVFGFTHDGSGHVITIDPMTGAGTLYGTFMDPTTHQGISFAGAGVNAKVPAVGIFK